MKFAYADPPYPGCCHRYGHEHGEDGLCWNDINTHAKLIATLTTDFPDGWAISTTSSGLKRLLSYCPPDVRIAAWVKPFCAFKRGVRPAYAWEPVIFRGGRNTNPPVPEKGGKQITPKDFHSAGITLKKGLVGAKPESFCRWVLSLLNAQPGDEVVDLFPGTAVMSRAIASMEMLK